jgi:uncharacterized protein (TIGR02452 family)
MSTKAENIAIWRDTIKQVLASKYKLTPSILYKELPLTHSPKYSTTIIDVVPVDTLTCCQELMSQGSVMGLNMASNRRAGGGVNTGQFTQEENCFRRSNYFQALVAPSGHKFYPLPENATIYSPKVTVIKDKYYQLLSTPFDVAMLACAALRNPPLQSDGKYAKSSDHEMMKVKIQQIFQVGYNHGHEILVLGSLGCGAYGNNPREVATLFNEVVKDYQGCFKMIVFAVLSHKDNNFKIFNEMITR